LGCPGKKLLNECSSVLVVIETLIVAFIVVHICRW